MASTRKPAVAGIFYPEKKKELEKVISDFISSINVEERAVNGIIVPHAGYIYSGKTASYAYKAFLNLIYDIQKNKQKERKIEHLILLGPAHRIYINDIFQDENTSWETPLGKINLKKIEVIKSNKRPHINEHSIEVQLPFVQFILQITKQEFWITPICVGEITKPQAVEYAKLLSNIDNSFFIASTDLSHFLPYEEATAKDKETIKKIINKDYEGIDACGIYPLMIIIEIAKLKNWSFKLLNYSTSAETNNDKTAVVGYASFLF